MKIYPNYLYIYVCFAAVLLLTINIILGLSFLQPTKLNIDNIYTYNGTNMYCEPYNCYGKNLTYISYTNKYKGCSLISSKFIDTFDISEHITNILNLNNSICFYSPLSPCSEVKYSYNAAHDIGMIFSIVTMNCFVIFIGIMIGFRLNERLSKIYRTLEY